VGEVVAEVEDEGGVNTTDRSTVGVEVEGGAEEMAEEVEVVEPGEEGVVVEEAVEGEEEGTMVLDPRGHLVIWARFSSPSTAEDMGV
jgi:hypothetical protein